MDLPSRYHDGLMASQNSLADGDLIECRDVYGKGHPVMLPCHFEGDCCPESIH